MTAWFDALAPGDPDVLDLRDLAAAYDSLADAWARSDDDALLVWLAARFASDDASMRALVATAIECIQTCVRSIPAPPPLTGLLPFFVAWLSGDRSAIERPEITSIALERSIVTCVEALLDASRAIDTIAKLRPRGPAIPTLTLELRFAARLAQSVRAAQAAYGAYTEQQGGVRARTPAVAALLRSRYRVDGDRIIANDAS